MAKSLLRQRCEGISQRSVDRLLCLSLRRAREVRRKASNAAVPVAERVDAEEEVTLRSVPNHRFGSGYAQEMQ